MRQTDVSVRRVAYEPTERQEREVFLSAGITTEGARVTVKGKGAYGGAQVVTLAIPTSAHAEALETLARAIKVQLRAIEAAAVEATPCH